MVVPNECIIEKFCCACLLFNHREVSCLELARMHNSIAVSETAVQQIIYTYEQLVRMRTGMCK